MLHNAYHVTFTLFFSLSLFAFVDFAEHRRFVFLAFSFIYAFFIIFRYFFSFFFFFVVSFLSLRDSNLSRSKFRLNYFF